MNLCVLRSVGFCLLTLSVAFARPVYAGPPQFIRGDCNADGAINIADAVLFLGYLFPPTGQPPAPVTCEDACDANDDGAINVADAIYLLNALLLPGAPPIPAPHPGCGSDPTLDMVGCGQSHPACVPSGNLLPITRIGQGSFSGLPTGDYLALSDQSWGMLWVQHTAWVTPAPPVPAVDFATEMVIGSVRDYGPGAILDFVQVEALPATVVASLKVVDCPSPLPVVTQPWIFVRVPLSPGTLVVDEFLATPPCP